MSASVMHAAVRLDSVESAVGGCTVVHSVPWCHQDGTCVHLGAIGRRDELVSVQHGPGSERVRQWWRSCLMERVHAVQWFGIPRLGWFDAAEGLPWL
jgi:hypothetical protein